ncbi:hypothetical protein Pan216_09110 [Planctomycetes bacterium Pan216]|uniref:Carboxypeptidase regulatory-like domain-containing protein n=1 Tax=Kolteria novifilia TaxID=2527975 RepID=A0A518AZC9_9BACT|nr:hypothetical protein Pan216_09110 [Planctomycetes bacterium Pan216]
MDARTARRLLLPFAILVCSGCGQGRRVPIQGTVTFDGRAVEEGVIYFDPITPGLSGIAPIRAGAFTIPASKGPTPGKSRVSIQAYEHRGRTEPDEFKPGRRIAVKDQIIPPEYNDQSKLAVDVSRYGETFHFELESSPQ